MFQTGKIDYIDNPERWSDYLDFSISAVPYPRSDSDTNLEQYQVPLSYEDMYVIRKLDNEENGLTESILFNIIDDITNGLIPLKNEKSYSDYLEEKIDSEESIKAILSLISDRYNQTYLEMIDVLSLTMGDGSHYAINGIYPQSNVIIVRKDDVPEVILNKLQIVYQEELDKLLGKNVNN